MKIKVYALVGSSGTGKSYKALNIARLKNIDYIIDDGILISQNKKVGGFSAKKETTKLAAVKRAIFYYDEHREEMKKLLKQENPSNILIIGTSNKMVNQIAGNLEILPIEHIYQIEDISTKEDIIKAKHSRKTEGKHVIPLPSVEVKKDFSGYFLDKLKVLIRKKGVGHEIAEKTIIRPTFSYIGKYTISTRAIYQMMAFSLYDNPSVSRFYKGKIIEENDGIVLICDIGVISGENLIKLGNEVQKTILRIVEDMTELNVKYVQINIKNIKLL